MTVMELMATLGLDTSSFTAGLKKAENSADEFSSKAANNLSSGTIALGHLMARGVEMAGRSILSLGKMGVAYNAQMEDYTTNFSVMLGSQEEAVAKVEELKQMAAKTPFGMEDLAGNTQTLLAFGIEAAQVMDILSMLGDVSLGNKNKMSSLTLAFAQISSAGKLTGQDLNQLINAGFNPLQIISEKTGVSIGDLKAKMSGEKGSREFQKQIKAAQKEVKKFGDNASESSKLLAQIGNDGMISAELVSWAFQEATEEGGRFYKGMEEASKTLSGQWNTLKDNLSQMIGTVFKPASDFLTNNLLPDANRFVEAISEAYKTDGLGGAVEVGLSLVLESVGMPDAEAVAKDVVAWWEGASETVTSGMTATAKFLGFEEWTEADTEKLRAWWDGVGATFESVVNWVIRPTLPDEAESEQIVADLLGWWDGIRKQVEEATTSQTKQYQSDVSETTGQFGALGESFVSNPDSFINFQEIFNQLFGGEETPSVAVGMEVSEESEGNLQSEMDSMELDGEAMVYADPGSELKLQSYLDSLNLHAIVTLTPDFSDMGEFPGHAVGLDYVPHDEYVARLHEGEAVLTKLEADRWRRGEGAAEAKGSAMPNITININGDVRDPYAAADEIKNALELYRWQG